MNLFYCVGISLKILGIIVYNPYPVRVLLLSILDYHKIYA
jgi:hypothetical protein